MLDVLRFVSLMSQNMDGFYRAFVAWLGAAAGVAMTVVDQVPWQERERRLDRGEVDVGVLCGLQYVRKVDRREPMVTLLAAPVMQAVRYQRLPVYFSDVVVRREAPIKCFADLRGRTWSYNELSSHSGYNLPRYVLARLNERDGFFRRALESGSHQESLDMVLDGRVDSAAVDSIVLEQETRRRPEVLERLRVIDTFGPSPVPPLVISTRIPHKMRRRLRHCMLAMSEDPTGRSILAAASMRRFVAIGDADYDPIRSMDRGAAGVRLETSEPPKGGYAHISTTQQGDSHDL